MKHLYQKLQQVPVPALALWALVIVVLIQAVVNYYLAVQERGVRAELNAIYQQNVKQYLLDQEKLKQEQQRLKKPVNPERSY